MKRLAIISGLLSCFILVNAQSKWTLRQCIDHAIENNIDIKQQVLDVENARIDLSTSKNSRLPNLNAGINQSFDFGRSLVEQYDSNGTTTGYGYENATTSNTGFNISSNTQLFTGFRISNEIKVRELNLLASMETLNKAKDNMELQVTSYYLETLFKKELLKVYQEQLALTNVQMEKTQILVETGKIPQSQLFDMKAQQANDELNVTTGKNALDLALLNLAQVLNLLDVSNFDIVDPEVGDVIAENISSILPVQQIFKTAIAIKPHVKVAEHNLESSKKNLKVAQSGYWPTLSLDLGYSNRLLHKYGNYENRSMKSQLQNNSAENIGLTLSIPIFDRFQTRNQVRSARLAIESNELALDNVKLVLFKEIQQAYQNAVAAQAKYTSTEKAAKASDVSFKYAQERYDVGKSTVFEYSEAQTKVLTSKSEQLQAKYDFLFRAKILDFYSGKPIEIN